MQQRQSAAYRTVIRVVGLLFVMGGSVLAAQSDDFPVVRNNERDADARPMSAGEAVSSLQLPDGFTASVFAAEPDVQNPIAMAWDDRGRMWVAENFTYSDRSQRFDLTLRDRVLIFEDTNQDGAADSRRVFTDKVQMLTSVEVGRGGVWLMCPPRLLFIPDADGDGTPDGPARVVLDGFSVAKDNYHNFANGLRWGPDGWLYGRCGHSCPGRLGVPGTLDPQRVPIDGGIWRFHPEREVVEVLCHGTVNPWGHDWDQHGELFFINTVIGHVWHVLPGSHFRESFGESRNPDVYERLDTIADHYHFDTTGKWSESRDGKANDLGGGHAHIGMMICQLDHWPSRYHNRLFTLNMHGRRANVERLVRRGAGYVAQHEPDFLVAADPFFRGIDMRIGPDGNAYVIDWSDTGECHEHTGVHRTSGRIFRISYPGAGESFAFSKPMCLARDGILSRLWRRYQAGETDPGTLRGLLNHPDEHVRAWAIRLLTDFWPLDTAEGPLPDAVYPDDPRTLTALRKTANTDESGLVHLVLASTLQRMAPQHRAAIARELVGRVEHADDPTLPALVWFGLVPLGRENPDALVEIASECAWPDTIRRITRFLAKRIERKPAPIDRLLTAMLDRPADIQQAVLAGLVEAFDGRRRVVEPESWRKFAAVDSLRDRGATIRELSTLFGDGRAMEEIRAIVADRGADLPTRRTALRTVIAARPADLREVCESLLSVRGVNGVAAEGLALFSDPDVGRLLAKNYRRFHPDDRPKVLEILVSRPVFAKQLLELVGSGKSPIRVADITPFHARQIDAHGDETLRKQLRSTWGDLRATPAERQLQIARLRESLTDKSLRKADLSRGRRLFTRSCAQCHRLFGDGAQIGPDLTGAQRTNLDYLLQNVVDPSAVVGKDFRMTTVVTSDGRSFSGLLVSRDQETLVLQTQNKRHTIAAEDIDDLVESEQSAMPDGLLQGLDPDRIRDLFAYLMHPVQVSAD